MCGEWQREIEGSGETEIETAGHEGNEKEIEESGGIKEDSLNLEGGGEAEESGTEGKIAGVGDGRED
jgi:hypothetical protein